MIVEVNIMKYGAISGGKSLSEDWRVSVQKRVSKPYSWTLVVEYVRILHALNELKLLIPGVHFRPQV